MKQNEQTNLSRDVAVHDVNQLAIVAPVIQGDFVFPGRDGVELVRISQDGFFFKGERIDDAGAAYLGFRALLESHGFQRPEPRSLEISFQSEQAALLKDSPVRAQDMVDPRDIVDAPGTVRIHRKKTEWMLALATQKVIPNTMEAVKQYLNENNPNPYTEQQLSTVQVEKDRRRHSKGYTVTINISGDGSNEVAFLSGPLAD